MLLDLRGKMFDPFQTLKEPRGGGGGGIAQITLSQKEKFSLHQDETCGNGPPIAEELS